MIYSNKLYKVIRETGCAGYLLEENELTHNGYGVKINEIALFLSEPEFYTMKYYTFKIKAAKALIKNKIIFVYCGNDLSIEINNLWKEIPC